MSRFGWRWRWSLALLVLPPGALLCAQDVGVALRDEAAVRGETIRLADLLPSGVSPTTRLAAENISLGRAPEPGSVRVLTGDELRGAVGGQMAVKLPRLAVVRGAGWPLRDASIRRALRESEAGQRYDFSGAQLIPPTDFSTRTSDPRLQVLAIAAEANVNANTNVRQLSTRLRCQQRSDCGSFVVRIILNGPLAASMDKLARRDEAVGAESKRRNPSTMAGRQAALVQPGRPAKMLFEGEGFKIATQVLPLQRAGLGQMVRVFDPAARHVSLAQVEGRDLMSFREAR